VDGCVLYAPPIIAVRTGDNVSVLSGVQPGDTIVTDGSFAVRAERDRFGLRSGEPAAVEAKVLLTGKGYEPAKLTVRAGQPARITFVRTTDKTCGREVAFQSLNIRRALPLNESVVIEFTPKDAGDGSFACGMNVLRGTVVAR
jgi:hypothetical protein